MHTLFWSFSLADSLGPAIKRLFFLSPKSFHEFSSIIIYHVLPKFFIGAFAIMKKLLEIIYLCGSHLRFFLPLFVIKRLRLF